jgi:hypothetical protein
MKADVENRRWYAQRLAEKKLRGECVFTPNPVQRGYVCVTHSCEVIAAPRPDGMPLPNYVCAQKLEGSR